MSDSYRDSVHNDDEQKLIQFIKNPIDTEHAWQINNNAGGVVRITLHATLVTDPNKNIIVEVKMGEQIRNLQVSIGEKMKTSFPDYFESLDGVRAFNITMEKDKQRQLNDWDLIDETFAEGDHIFFEIDSINFWLRIKFLLYHRQSPLLTENEEEKEKLYIEGYTRLRVNKQETGKYLRKQL